jgi:tryptophanase
MDYVIEVVERVAYRASDLPGMQIVSQPKRLRHFTARFEPTN